MLLLVNVVELLLDVDADEAAEAFSRDIDGKIKARSVRLKRKAIRPAGKKEDKKEGSSADVIQLPSVNTCTAFYLLQPDENSL
jgi:hypothetical protein